VNKKTKSVIIGCGIVLLGVTLFILVGLFLFVFPTNELDNRNPIMRAEMLKTTLDACDLAPIPNGGRLIEVSTNGNSFARSFRVVFSADAATIKEWLHDSPGIKTANSVNDGSTTKYTISPKSGWERAEMNVKWPEGKVTILLESS